MAEVTSTETGTLEVTQSEVIEPEVTQLEVIEVPVNHGRTRPYLQRACKK